MRPGSMNGWAYVEESPINSIDPSGMLPEGLGPNDFEKDYRYSCNCGWIDWAHAGNPTVEGGDGVYNEINSLYRKILKTPVPGDFDYKVFSFNIQQDLPILGWSGVEWTVYAKNHLSDDQAKRVTMGMSMLLSLGFELFQGGHFAGPGQFVIRNLMRYNLVPSAASSFAVEDLTSNTIAMYRVLKGFEQRDIEEICNVLSAEQSWNIYQQNPELTGINQNFSFWLPKYACELGGACANGSAWPSELLDIEPQWPERGIWEILDSTVRYSGGFKSATPFGLSRDVANQLGLP